MSVPCNNCLIIPICRNKYFFEMKMDCSLIEQYLFCGMTYNRRREDFDKRITKVKILINPKFWTCGVHKNTKNKYFTYKSRSKI